MASKEHRELAHYVKEVHSSLRQSSVKLGAEEAWQSHCENKDVLKKYAQCMQKLATAHWAENNDKSAECRISWVAQFCLDYYMKKSCTRHRQKEIEIVQKLNIELNLEEESYSTPLKFLDVGSCYNPFDTFDYFDVTAIDLCPANDSVLECDFLKVPIGLDMIKCTTKLEQVPQNYFDVTTFCFVLEYIPSSELRIQACEKAYNVLKPGGLLIINTPDSKHVGANSKTMKCWQYTLAVLGFIRIKYEKKKHMHCMAFRKAVCKDVARRWARIHENPGMEFALHIPQDFNSNECEEISPITEIEVKPEDFQELPFFD